MQLTATTMAFQVIPLRHSPILQLRTATTTTCKRIGATKEEPRLQDWSLQKSAVGVADRSRTTTSSTTLSSHPDDRADAVVTKNKKQRFSFFFKKRHFLLGTPTLPPWTYPLLDAAFIVTYSYIVYFLLTGTTRLAHAIWCGIHVPLAVVTNYYSRFFYIFPNIPIVPLPFMYIYDASWAVFIILSPFFLQYNKAWHMLIHTIGAFSLLSLAFLDPKPYEFNTKKQQ
jgi:hypothetical protein